VTAALPDEPSTHVFEWSLAVQQGRVTDARRLIEQARASGLGEERRLGRGAVGLFADFRTTPPPG
jgi:hypothetical protein